MKKLFVYLREYRRDCVLAPLFKMLEAAFDLAVPLVVASIIDRGIPAGDRGHIVWMVLLLCLLAAVGLSASVAAQFFSARAAVGFSTKLRHALMEHLQSLSYADLDTQGVSTLITRMTSDVNQVQSGVNMGLRLLLRSPFVVFGAMVMAFTIDARCALIFVGVIAVLLVIVFAIILTTIPMYRGVQQQLDSVTLAARENLTGVRVLRAFGKEEAEKERFDVRSRRLEAMQLAAGRISASLNPVTSVVINLAILLLLRSGALRVNAGTLTQGQVVALYNYMGQILVELIKMANLIILLTKAAACGDRIAAVLAVHSRQQDGQERPEAHKGSVEFRNVSMRYPEAGADALEGISFTAAPGETIGIIGGTGSGKSTLVNLIPRFYDASAGEVLVDGLNVQRFAMADLRRRIGVVPQHALLFSGTIRSNLLWGNDGADDEALMRAICSAQAEDVIRGKAKGLDEPVEQGGRNFSGGQRQRLTIARALVRHPEILILDDSASALDYATDAALRRAIRALPDAPTTFIVSQRTASVRFADRILVLDDGRLIGCGTHEELLASCPVYREIHESQFGGEEEHHG